MLLLAGRVQMHAQAVETLTFGADDDALREGENELPVQRRLLKCWQGNEGDPCSRSCSCKSGLTCDARSEKCHPAGDLGDPCWSTRPCASGLQCVSLHGLTRYCRSDPPICPSGYHFTKFDIPNCKGDIETHQMTMKECANECDARSGCTKFEAVRSGLGCNTFTTCAVNSKPHGWSTCIRDDGPAEAGYSYRNLGDYTITASSDLHGNVRVLDDYGTAPWQSTAGTNQWIQFKAPKSVTVAWFRVRKPTEGKWKGTSFKNFLFQYSNDGTNWKTALKGVGKNQKCCDYENYTLYSLASAQYFRLYMKDTWGADRFVLGYIEFAVRTDYTAIQDMIGEGRSCGGDHAMGTVTTISTDSGSVANCYQLALKHGDCDGRYFQYRGNRRTCQCSIKGLKCWKFKTFNCKLFRMAEKQRTGMPTPLPTARPTTARPTTARPTTARPTTARPTPSPTQGSVIKTGWKDPVLESTAWGVASKAIGPIRLQTQNLMLVFNVQLPSTVSDGVLFEAGGTGRGSFVGIVDGKFRFSAGDGGDNFHGSDKDTAVISVDLPDSRIPLDGQEHEVACMVVTSSGEIRLYIDGVEIARGASTSGAFEGNQWQGGDNAGFGVHQRALARGGTKVPWPVGTSGLLRVWMFDTSMIVQAHDASKCLEKGSFDADCTGKVSETKCADGFVKTTVSGANPKKGLRYACTPPASLLRNGGFEIGTNNQIPEDWLRYNAHGSTGLRSTEQVHSGSWAIKYTGAGWQLIENGPSELASKLNLKAGISYRLTFFARSTSSGQHIRTEFLKYPVADGSKSHYTGGVDTSGVDAYLKAHHTTEANTWQRFAHTITPKEDQSIVRINIGPNGVSGALFVDDVELVEWTGPEGSQIKNRHGICLDAGERSKHGGKVHMWSCDTSNKNQQWTYNASTGQIKNLNTDFGEAWCLDASQRGSVGGKVHMWQCDTANLNQQWTYSSETGQIKAIHGLCLDAMQRNDNGGKVHMWDCDTGNTNQQWAISTNFRRRALADRLESLVRNLEI